jgi:2-polyprenyl-3-methyl-5-hydroxy-6-metoxy-1,4-benzoquinol methylase
MIDRSYKQDYTDIFREFLKEGLHGCYDEAALPSYTHNSRVIAWLFWQRIKVALSMAGNLENESVLDFGCGGGVTFRYLSERSCRITGCDCHFYEMAIHVCKVLNIKVQIYRDLFQIMDTNFDCILALDVLEHIEDDNLYIEKLIDLAHDKTRIIISGPTENLLYKTGRQMAGFSGDYHLRNIYHIEQKFRDKGLKRNILKRLYPPFTLFRISSWSKQRKNQRKGGFSNKEGLE